MLCFWRSPRDKNTVLPLAAESGETRLCQLTSDKNLQTSDKWFVASSSFSSDIYFSFALSLNHFISRLQHCRVQALLVVVVEIPGVGPPAEHAPPGNIGEVRGRGEECFSLFLHSFIAVFFDIR